MRFDWTNKVCKYEPRFVDRWFTGHLAIGRIVIYGANAMHWAVNIQCFGGYLCLHPTTKTFGGRWSWYIYFSRNATPRAAKWGFGPGFKR